ncbi:peptidoglycan -binding protein [Pseudooceanicola sp. HF7]|uniref:peptidoglycan -binding protein n=1 Tax=Pseudooceanicola sp. HF7 TaxID=2721560 RepID=UPI001431CCB3|nr:peptidoglycan -binding protein [Pseudooceanicola sp. HF7]NIZ11059.1 peptidoglycan -binding protein [Pseudooceanicola sp. HF7]
MALSRRSGARLQANIWPGFVDAMTGLLMVLMFVLTIFMIMQYALQETITGQESELDTLQDTVTSQRDELGELAANLAALSRTLGLERERSQALEGQVTDLSGQVDEQSALINSLIQQRDQSQQQLQAAQSRITDFEAQVATLLSQRDDARDTVAELEGERDRLADEQEALNLAVARARDEIDAQTEAARLAAARREALEALVADLKADQAEAAQEAAGLSARVGELEQQLSGEEAEKLAESEAARRLRERLQNSQDELTAMTLALEEQRQKAEDTLTLLAAAEAARDGLDEKLAAALLEQQAAEADAAALETSLAQAQDQLDSVQEGSEDRVARLAALQAALEAAQGDLSAAELDAEEVRKQLTAALAAKLAAEQEAEARLSEAEQRAILLQQANAALAEEEAQSAESQRKATLLNQQVAALRTQLGSLQSLLDDYKERDAASQVQIQSLGSDLNAALAQVAAAEKKERERLAAEAERLQQEAEQLKKFRSDFFGRMREVLAGQDGVRIVGDRFVFSSEVLFDIGSADLATEGEDQIDQVAGILFEVADEIPDGIDWIIRVDGHTDDVPISGAGQFADNWELSQARALSVVRYMISLGIPPQRLSANGFGEYQPIAEGSSPDARAQNRRIELKFTER